MPIKILGIVHCPVYYLEHRFGDCILSPTSGEIFGPGDRDLAVFVGRH
jgi:hypothetical protein